MMTTTDDDTSLTLDDMLAYYSHVADEMDAIRATIAPQLEALEPTLKNLEMQIKAQVLRLGVTRSTHGVIAKFSAGRGKYDYERIAKEMNANAEIIRACTKLVVDWKTVADTVGIPKHLGERFYTPGTPSVTIERSTEAQ